MKTTPHNSLVARPLIARLMDAACQPASFRPVCLAIAIAIVVASNATRAADSNPPQRMTYQGYLVDANGAVLAPTTPINYPMVFRIYNVATGGTSALWAEQQVVTVDKGNFNVLLGDGTNVGSELRPNLSTVFSGTTASDRFIGVTVTVNGSPLVIAPRLRLLPSPYAFLASGANSLVQPNGSSVLSYNSGNNRVEVTGNVSASGFIGSGSGLTGFSASQIPDLAASKITSGVLSSDRLPSSFTGDKFFMGNVGIGTATPSAKLEIQGGAGNDGSGDLKDLAFAWSGGGFRHWIRSRHNSTVGGGNAIDFYLNNSASPTGSSAPGTGSLLTMTLDSGRVGIGTSDPSAKLHVSGGGMKLDGFNTMEFGAGLSGKQSDAGKIGYGTFTTDALDIVGGGTSAANRKIKLWAEGGVSMSGNLGVGTANPQRPLHVSGSQVVARFEGSDVGGTWMSLGNSSVSGSNTGYWWQLVSTGTGNGEGAGQLLFRNAAFGSGDDINGNGNAGVRMTLTKEGRLGIGTTTPAAPLDVKGFGSSSVGYAYYARSGNAPFTGYATGTVNYSILAEARVGAVEFNAFSDERIKELVGPSNIGSDLEIIRKLRVVDYRPVDKIAEGNDLKKGFIAQEVQRIIPEAVTSSRRFVPDIYSLPTAFEFDDRGKMLTVTLPKAHQAKPGDRVQLFADDSRLELTISTVLSPEKFTVEKCETRPKNLFVYGREVSDFRTLNYDRIFTTGIGAMQELARQTEALKSSQATQAARVAELEAKASKVDVLEREIGELKKLVARLAEKSEVKSAARALPKREGLPEASTQIVAADLNR